MIKLISDFEKEVLNDSSEYTSKRQLGFYLKSSDAKVVVLYDSSNRICAYAIGTVRHFKRPSGRILKLAVRKDKRRKGFGKRLLAILEDYFRKKSMEKIFAEVRKSNNASLSLFKKSGYKISGTLFGYYGCQNDDYILEDGFKLVKELDVKQTNLI